MGNIVARVAHEPISLEFRTSVLPLHHVGSLVSALYPRLPVYVALCLRLVVSADYYTTTVLRFMNVIQNVKPIDVMQTGVQN